MKKLLALLLISTCVINLAACGSPKSTEVNGILETDETTSTESNAADEQEVDLSIGKAEGNVYKSEFIGIGFNLPSGWTFYTDEQIRELNNFTTDMLEEDLQKAIQDANLIYDMYAQDASGNNVAINLEKVSALGSVIHSEEDYIDASLPALKDALTSVGFSTVTTQKINVTLAGETHPAISIVASNGQVTVYEKVVCKKIGNYIACIAIATPNTDITDSVLNQFYAL